MIILLTAEFVDVDNISFFCKINFWLLLSNQVQGSKIHFCMWVEFSSSSFLQVISPGSRCGCVPFSILALWRERKSAGICYLFSNLPVCDTDFPVLCCGASGLGLQQPFQREVSSVPQSKPERENVKSTGLLQSTGLRLKSLLHKTVQDLYTTYAHFLCTLSLSLDYLQCLI